MESMLLAALGTVLASGAVLAFIAAFLRITTPPTLTTPAVPTETTSLPAQPPSRRQRRGTQTLLRHALSDGDRSSLALLTSRQFPLVNRLRTALTQVRPTALAVARLTHGRVASQPPMTTSRHSAVLMAIGVGTRASLRDA
jgi:hypothetical protein